MTEQDYLNHLKEIETETFYAKQKMTEAKRVLLEAESRIIELKLQKEKVAEELRVFKKQSPIQPPSSRDLEVQAFRERNPEVCKMADERDQALREGKKND